MSREDGNKKKENYFFIRIQSIGNTNVEPQNERGKGTMKVPYDDVSKIRLN